MDFYSILNWVLLALGFGFVIFWHELGHFIAAKWAKVKVEQFAVGFGTAALAWRKGIGLRVGTTRPEYEKRCREYLRSTGESQSELDDQTTDDQKLDSAGRALNLGETEYRLNWLPLGGYVKMLGQDDLDPNSRVTDPRAYNMQPISKRMVIVSAGVIMNIILAAVGFSILFRHGFKVQPAKVGAIIAGSPAQRAGLSIGDRIVSLDGGWQADFTKIVLNVALLPDDRDVPITVRHVDGQEQTFSIRPVRPKGEQRGGMLAIGIGPEPALAGVDPEHSDDLEKYDPQLQGPDGDKIKPGDVITKVNGADVAVDLNNPNVDDYYVLDRAVQKSDGKPVELSVRDTQGTQRTESFTPEFEGVFDESPIEFAGMVARSRVDEVKSDSIVKGIMLPGDVISLVRVQSTNDAYENPSREKLMKILDTAGQSNTKVEITVLRGDKTVTLDPLVPSITIPQSQGRKGLKVGLNEVDADHPVIADVLKPSSAADAGIVPGATITSIENQPVATWYDVKRILSSLKPGEAASIAARMPDSNETKTFSLHASREELDRVRAYRYGIEIALRDRIEPRHTDHFLVAARWGVGETRDLIVQFYLTIKRMIQRSVPASNLMGPVGIVTAGHKFAHRGPDWLLWFLSMISANLAVVNFLPIPIVDGGLFFFLIIEKLQGRPLSARTMSIAQFVGLALILSVFVFVTYQDFMRF